MITSWMSYTLAVSSLVTVAAAVLERVALAKRWPMRFVWGAALALSVMWPILYAAARLAPASAPPSTVLPFTVTVPAIVVTRAGVDAAWLSTIDRVLLSLWLVASVARLARLGRAMVMLRRSQRTWTHDEIDGTTVRISPNVGPAVIGLRQMDVVLPEWIRALDTPLRAIVLRHEEEHRIARDPYLLFGAAIAVALMPWNLPLWLQAHRLRLAIEMDCDARVLRAHPSRERYGLLMLTIAQRRSAAPTLFAPMLSEPTTNLERRILAMRPITRRLARLTVFGGSAVALVVLGFACSLQSDTTNIAAPKPSTARAPTPASGSQTFFEFQVENPVRALPGNPAPRYPDALRSAGVEGSVLAQFVVGPDSVPDMSTVKVLRTSDDQFTAAVLATLARWRFAPAQVGGRSVKQLVQIPFQFSLAGSPASVLQRQPFMVTRPQDAGKATRDTQTVRRLATVFTTARPAEILPTPKDPRAATPAYPIPGNRAPRYPDALRTAHVEGEVLAQFVVDTNGVADVTTFKVLRSTDPAFTDAVREALPAFRFAPAEVSGRHVRQLIQMPFEFNLTKR